MPNEHLPIEAQDRIEALKARIAELESFQPAQVLDVLDTNRKLETNLRIQVEYATNLEKENEYLDDRYFKLHNRNIRDCHERDRYREALEFYTNPAVYRPDSTGRVGDLTFVAVKALKKEEEGSRYPQDSSSVSRNIPDEDGAL